MNPSTSPVESVVKMDGPLSVAARSNAGPHSRTALNKDLQASDGRGFSRNTRKGETRLSLCLSAGLGLWVLFLSGFDARAWNIIDLAFGTNYISSPGTYTNQVYFSSYLVTNDTATAFSNLWVRMGSFTNGAGIPNISLLRGAPDKQNLGQLNAAASRAVFFCLNGTNSSTSATNRVSLYNGDPDNG